MHFWHAKRVWGAGLLVAIAVFPAFFYSVAQEKQDFCSNLPIIVAKLKQPFPTIDPNASRAQMKAKIEVDLMLYDQGSKNCLTGTPTIVPATMHYRGSSSLFAPKHQYTVKLKDLTPLGGKPFLNMKYGGKSWVFSADSANYDGTFLRNPLGFYLQRRLGDLAPDSLGWAPRTRFFELLIQQPNTPLDTDTNYAGLYTLAESIRFAKHRINPVQVDSQSVLYKIDDPTKAEPDDKMVDNGYGVNVFVQDTLGVKVNQQQFSANDNLWEQAFSLWSHYITLPDAQQKTVIGNKAIDLLVNEASFAVFFLVNELIKDPDGYDRSTYLFQTYTKTGFENGQERGKLTTYAGPLWDKALGYALSLPPNEYPGTGGFLGYPDYLSPTGFGFKLKNVYWHQMMATPALQAKICSLFYEAKDNGLLTSKAIKTYLDTLTLQIKGPIPTEGPLARDCNHYYPNTPCVTQYDKKVEALTTYIDARLAQMSSTQTGETALFGSTQADCPVALRDALQKFG